MNSSERCVLVPTPHGKRLKLMSKAEVRELAKEGRVKKVNASLWEVLPEEVVEESQPASRTRNSHGGKRK